MAGSKNAEFVSHRADVLKAMNKNASRAAKALGEEAVGLIVTQMKTGYGKPIRQTGDLMRDVNFKVQSEGDGKLQISVGNGLEYAVHVHEGTSKMAGRPYIKDGIMGGKDRLRQVAEEYLKEGF